VLSSHCRVVHCVCATLVQVSRAAARAALRGFLQARLARTKLPKGYTYVGEPLRGDDGKVRRDAVRRRVLDARPRARL
jgi:hypothetical protein